MKKRLLLLMTLIASLSAWAIEQDNTPLSHDWVDLGLPSGTLWATTNIGATNPEDFGDYFAWGETQPKDVYDWSTYMWCNGSNFALTKYNNDSSHGNNGFVDNKTELEPEDDAATANWGSEWRMPSLEQIQELLNNCTTQWTAINGVNGRLLTSTINGETLFIPANGYLDGSTFNGGWGNYWSRTLDTSFSPQAYYLNFGSGLVRTYSLGRHQGFSVRAVRYMTYSITLPESFENGMVTCDKESATEGETVTLTVTPDNGYELETLTVTTVDATLGAPIRANVDLTEGENGTYTFDMPAAPVTINATFKETTVTVDLEQDDEGYYLIGSVEDWQAFSAIVAETPTANAKMIADVNLGDDQTRIGDLREVESGIFYQGVFDGQGHTLTIAYSNTEGQTTADPQSPFTHINGATIKNLHVAGTVETSHGHSAIVAWVRGGTNVISNVWSSLVVTNSRSGWDECSAVVSWIGHANLTIEDCLFTGSINAINGSSHNGCFVGWRQYGDSNVQIKNSLSIGSFEGGSGWDATCGSSYANSYIKQFPATIPNNMQCTDEQLADGTIATALQAGRTEDVWVQDETTGAPMLKIFIRNCDVDGDGIVTSSDVTALYNYLLNGDETYIATSDVDGDGSITVADITTIYNIILGSK
ncbi:MAG: hypothetical protein IKX63_04420 [Muribaculaceae bacterium]|nr:hypothetical protein [Muribaculaceae bacterium]